MAGAACEPSCGHSLLALGYLKADVSHIREAAGGTAENGGKRNGGFRQLGIKELPDPQGPDIVY